MTVLLLNVLQLVILRNNHGLKIRKLLKMISYCKVIDIIQDASLLASRKQSREVHCDDPLILTMTIDQCLVKRILVHTGSSVNVLFKETFRQMDIPWDKVSPYVTPLVRFTSITIKSEGKISFPVSIGETVHIVEFLIVSAPLPYNCILGQTGIESIMGQGIYL